MRRFSSCICSILIVSLSLLHHHHHPFVVPAAAFVNLTLPHQHPNPEAVVHEFNRIVAKASLAAVAGYRTRSRRGLLEGGTAGTTFRGCLTGNPIDDCWRCEDWTLNPQHLADCGIGFGASAQGGKGGYYYAVSDSSDLDVVNPRPGTLRHAVIQDTPLWIYFTADMVIQLRHELIMNSYKTIDGRGYVVHITGNGCLRLQGVSNIIIHNIHIHDCKPSGNTNIRSSPSQVQFRGMSDGDGISISGSNNIWIDHCSLWQCTDGLIDATLGSTAITISNNYMTRHNEVMLLGHHDSYVADKGMQVTIAFNHFGEGLVQRMPRCRHGYIHVVNNDFTHWQMYAIGGSAAPTVNSQGNRYTAPFDSEAKQVTKRVDTDEGEWTRWNWRTEGDIMLNGAFFVPSGAGSGAEYAKASSVEPKTVEWIDQLTTYAGVFGDPRFNTPAVEPNQRQGQVTGTNPRGGLVGAGGVQGHFWGMIPGSSAAAHTAASTISTTALLLSLVISIRQFVI